MPKLKNSPRGRSGDVEVECLDSGLLRNPEDEKWDQRAGE